MAEHQTDDPTRPGFVSVCAIGASAGGVGVLQTLFRLLPDDLGLAYVVVVHLAPDHPSAMQGILAACTRMPVFQVQDGPTLRANSVYVIPPDRELVIEGDDVTARPFTDPRGRRAPIDMFFRSVAAARGDGIAVVLTGGGSDGALGVRAVKEAGGLVMVQEPAEAGFPSMPQNAIATGMADVVAPVARLAERIAEAARSKEAVRSLDEDEAANDLRRIVTFLRTRTGHDFSGYKRSTVLRRVARRMQVCQINGLADYARHLYATPEEAKALFADLLISVTQFFRDPETFEALKHHIVRPMLESAGAAEKDGEVRAWVVGCATGEEAYSLAILILEEAESLKVHIPTQIFATDLDEGALATAREGRYPRSIETDVSPERLRRFFVDEGTHYRIGRGVRDLVLFATHSVVREPPFLRLDLVTCRNVLIYLERTLQQHVCGLFHYGLKPGGALFLGPAETADMAQDRFSAVNREARIYRARSTTASLFPILAPASPMGLSRLPPVADRRPLPPRFEGGEAPRASHAAALEASAPPSALVDEDHVWLHLSPTAGRFILLSAGPPTGKLSSIVHPELRLDLKMALDRTFDSRQPTMTRLVDLRLDGEMRRVSIHVAPVPTGEGSAARAVAYFLDNGPSVIVEGSQNLPDPDDLRQLHGELKAAQEAALAGRIGHEAALQELRASNEELQSLNEEYRSTAEELETSKEELQSINEELHTVNAELKSKLTSISVAHSDLQNLTDATEIGTLFLDADLRIKMFTPPIADIFNITAVDVGRPITDFTHQLDYDAIERDARRVLADLAPFEREVTSREGRWYVMRLRPYRTVEDRIEGTGVTFIDITGRRAMEDALSRSERQLRALVRASSQVLYRMSPDWREMRELLGAGMLFNTDRPTGDWFETYIPAEERDRVRAVIRDAVESQSLFDLEHRVHRADGSVGWVHSRAVGFFDENGTVTEWFGSASDVTARHEAEVALRESEERFRAMADTAPVLIWEVDESGIIFVNGHYLDFFGVGFEEVRGVGWERFLHPEDAEAHKAAYRRAFAERRPYAHEARFRRADGQYRWLRNSAGPAGERGFIGCSLDVTDLLETQFALRDSEERFAQFAASSSDALWIRDADTLEMEYVSPAIQPIYGVPPERLLDGPDNWTSLILPADRDKALAHLEQAKAGGAVVHEFRISRPSDGAMRWIRNTDFPLRDHQGRVQRIGGIAKDVTDMKATEAALTHSEQRLRNLVEGVPLLVWRAVDGGVWTWASPQWTAYTGQSEFDSHHLGWLEAVHPEDRDRAREAWSHASQTGRFDVEYRIRRAFDGAYRWFQTQATPVRGEDGEILEWLGTSTDIEDLKNLQESQSVMVAELQHRTRNLIAVVRGVANDTMDETGPTEAFRAAFADRLSALSRVQGLLSRSEAQPITIGALVRLELDALGANKLGERVALAGPEVFLRPSTVQTLALALHELATNARKYGALSHDGGRLAVTWRERIETGEGRLTLDWVETGLEQAGDRTASACTGSGYGRELIEHALPHTLGARTSYDLTVSGVRCTIDIPVRPGSEGKEP